MTSFSEFFITDYSHLNHFIHNLSHPFVANSPPFDFFTFLMYDICCSRALHLLLSCTSSLYGYVNCICDSFHGCNPLQSDWGMCQWTSVSRKTGKNILHPTNSTSTARASPDSTSALPNFTLHVRFSGRLNILALSHSDPRLPRQLPPHRARLCPSFVTNAPSSANPRNLSRRQEA